MKSRIECRMLVALLGAAGLAAVARADLNDVWKDPSFQKAFVGSYGMRADIEPRVTPAEQQTLQQVATLMESEGGLAKAIDLLQRSLQTGGKSGGKAELTALFDYTLGNLCLQQNQVEAALDWYRKAAAKFPSFLRAQKNLGVTCIRLGNHEQAIQVLTRAIDLGAADGLTFGLLGYAFSTTEQYVPAESAYRQAMMLQSDVSEWKLGLSRCLFKQRKYEEAAALCEDLIRRDPGKADFWLLQANAFLGLKQSLKAAENFELLDRNGQASAVCLNTLGDIYVNENIYDLAADAYLRALAKDPAGADPLLFLRDAEVLIARAAYEPAARVLAQVRATCETRLPEDAKKRILKLEARLAAARGEAAEEQTHLLEQIVALDPLDGEALILLAQHYARTDRADKALFLFERAEGIEKYEAEARLRHAQVLVKKTRYAEAVPLLKRSQELRPREDVARYLDQVERAARSRAN